MKTLGGNGLQSIARCVPWLKIEIEQIQRALHRIDAGTYGICESCGAEIAPARLEAQPDATRCINCAA